MAALSTRPAYAAAPFHDQRATDVGRTSGRSYSGISVDSAMRQHRRDDIVPLIRNAFSTVPAYLSNVRAPNDHLEVEMSLGITVDNQFHSRVRESDWFEARNMCHHANHGRAPESVTLIDHWYPDVERFVRDYNLLVRPVATAAHRAQSSLRVTTNTAGEVVQCQVKNHCLVQTFNGATLASPAYDVRLHVNYEQTLDALRQQLSSAPDGWTHRRVKNRTRYYLSAAPEWAIDLTLVGGADDEPLYEIEVELLLGASEISMAHNVREQMAARGEFAFQNLLSHMNVIRGRRRQIGPPPPLDVFGDWQHADDATSGRAARQFARGMGYRDATQRPYAGSMPVELTRERWQGLLANRANVWVAEKTDGVRLALVIDKELGVCTLDRNGASYQLSTLCPELGQAIAAVRGLTENGATVLDAELVHNEAAQAASRHMLLVFDLAMLNGMPCGTTAFGERQAQMRRVVTELLAPAVHSVPHEKRPFGIRAKRFVELRNFVHLRHRMDHWKPGTEPRERMIHYDEWHEFLVDGLVLVNSADNRHYKWKPAWKSTVDFFGEPNRATGQVALSVMSDGDDKLLHVGYTTLSAAQLDQLARIYIDNELLSRTPPRQPPPKPLFECRYDTTSRRWVLVRFRTDKRRPNHFSVALDAALSLSNPLTMKEMIEQLT